MDLLSSFESCHLSVEILLEMFPVLAPRSYSLIEECLEKPSQKLNFAFTMFYLNESITKGGMTYDGITIKRYNRRTGVATGYMYRLWKEMASTAVFSSIYLSVHSSLNNFYHPENPLDPLILICAGSGIAPFIGFLQYRQRLSRENASEIGETWLVFGCREPGDLLFSEELADFVESGTIGHLCLCFSRFSGHLPPHLPETIRRKAIVPVGCKYVQDCILSSSPLTYSADGDNTEADLLERLRSVRISSAGVEDSISSRLTELVCLRGGHVRVSCIDVSMVVLGWVSLLSEQQSRSLIRFLCVYLCVTPVFHRNSSYVYFVHCKQLNHVLGLVFNQWKIECSKVLCL